MLSSNSLTTFLFRVVDFFQSVWLVVRQLRTRCEFFALLQDFIEDQLWLDKSNFLFGTEKGGYGQSYNTVWLWSNPTLIWQRAGVPQTTSSPRWQRDSSPSRGQNSKVRVKSFNWVWCKSDLCLTFGYIWSWPFQVKSTYYITLPYS